MSDLIIKGMDMPKDYKQRSATLNRQTDDGILRLFVYDFDSEAMKYSCRVYPIVEVPTPHGRLIDADAHIQSLKENQCGERCRKNHDCVNCGIGMYIRIVENEPTILEAEE